MAQSMVRDIARRRWPQEALSEGKNHCHRYFEEDSVVGHFISTPSGKLVACNSAFAQMLGLASVEEAMKRNVTSFYPDPRAREVFLELLQKKKHLDQFESELRRSDGRPVHVVEHAQGIFNDQGELTEIEGYLLDITKHKELEGQLLQAQKMEVVGRLAGGIAHDFNNLLTGIIGFTQLLLAQMQPDSPQTRDLMQIQELADRATKLIGQLLAFSRKEKIEAEVLNLSTLVAKMEPMLRRLIGEDIEVVIKTSSEVGPIKADPGQLEQVLMNLIVNARAAMPKGGKLIIETADVMLDRDYANTDERIKAGPHVMLAVSDTGCGMDQATQARIFEPFFTTKKVGEGTGLGLSTVYGIVKQHEGYVFVYSEPGQGTSFKIYLPCVDAEEQKEILEPKAVAVPRGSETILVAEDEKPVRTVIQRTLEKQGYTVLTAANPKEAEELFTQHEGNIALLVTDMVMPGGDGRDLYRLLTARGLRQVLYISGYTDSAALHMGLLDSNEPYLQKPFAPGALAGAVRGVLDGRIQ